MYDVILDTLIDGIKLLPFLFAAFLIIEVIEHKLGNKGKKTIAKAGKFGPIIGSLLGVIPQCGFSVMATNLYITRIVSLGTLISIYLSTSDEMLPILISEHASIDIILKILLVKVIIGIVCGVIIDFVLRKKDKKKIDYAICEHDHCHCGNGIIKSTLRHTFNVLIFILLITFILNLILHFVGEDYLSKIFLKNTLIGPFLGSLIGLIPNCGASVMITELYLNNAINFGTTIAGLLTGSGVALLVLFKSNKNMKENFIILTLIYGIGVISGIIIELISMLF